MVFIKLFNLVIIFVSCEKLLISPTAKIFNI